MNFMYPNSIQINIWLDLVKEFITYKRQLPSTSIHLFEINEAVANLSFFGSEFIHARISILEHGTVNPKTDNLN